MKILLIGDSLTYGYGVDHDKSWAYLLSKNKSIDIINKGINGDTTAGMLFRAYEDISSNLSCFTVIMGGSNDILSDLSYNYVKDNIILIIEEAQSLGSEPILAIQPPVVPIMAERLWSSGVNYYKVNEEIKAYRNEILSYAIDNRIKYIDFFTPFHRLLEEDKAINYYLDGLHLNSKGNQLLYDLASKIIFS
ncbi:GDSL-type esterase/lipase family protein [Clostridium omnivorum]|uniref:Peptidase n=1 Tax=Clostridium omnivorum TaxID=1604902 RepID=A0ABQ5N842_9CLOT|nr:GDSL-type esterase/lipase family protein [Clostridium sp. E14]GLC31376.1 peptidase [Clostridium sp. E14]